MLSELVGDGKILVHGAVADPVPPDYSRRLNLLVDTGATKCVLFEETLDPAARHPRAWPTLRGLTAPTLIGTVAAGSRWSRRSRWRPPTAACARTTSTSA